MGSVKVGRSEPWFWWVAVWLLVFATDLLDYLLFLRPEVPLAIPLILEVTLVTVLRVAVLLTAYHSLLAVGRRRASALVLAIEPVYYVLFMAADAAVWWLRPLRSLVYPWARSWGSTEIWRAFAVLYGGVFGMVALHSLVLLVFIWWAATRQNASVAVRGRGTM